MTLLRSGYFRFSLRTTCYSLCALAGGLWSCGGGGATPDPENTGGALTTGGAGGSLPMGTAGSARGGSGGSATGSGGTASPAAGSPGSAGTPSGSGGSGSGSGGAPGTAGSGTAGSGTAGSGDSTGSGGVATGTGGSGASGEGSGGTGSGGDGAAGTGSAGEGGMVTFDKPEGTIPNDPQPSGTTDLPKDQWQKGLISPSMQVGKQINQPSVINGYLAVAGNEEFWMYDVSNPKMPRQLSSFSTPNKTGGEAESHTVSFARYGDTFYMVTIGGRGIDTWDVTDETAPRHLAQLRIDGTNYGDYTEAVWGVTWQGQHIYVGATNNGIKVVDAANPAELEVVGQISTSQYGGVSAGPVDAIGNVLVVTTPKESGGIATLDISDPTKPVRLASLTTDKSYIGMFYRRWVFLITPNRAWDVLSNPKSIGSGSSPVGQLNTPGAEYLSFQDDFMFLGRVRAEIGGDPGISKIDVKDPKHMSIVSSVWGRMDKGGVNDDQFNIAMGNLVVIGDDQSPYAGWVIGVHQTEPDTTAPVIDTVIPKNETTAVSTKTSVGVTFSDNIELATVNAASFIVRPVGGQPLAGKFGLRMGVVNFDPDEDLQPGTTYEVVLPQGGVADLVGNTLETEWKSTFTTN